MGCDQLIGSDHIAKMVGIKVWRSGLLGLLDLGCDGGEKRSLVFGIRESCEQLFSCACSKTCHGNC